MFAFSFLRYVLECPECGVIYRSRQFWYGNRDPVELAVRAEIRHVWPGVGYNLIYTGFILQSFRESKVFFINCEKNAARNEQESKLIFLS